MSLARRPGGTQQALANRPEWVGVGADNSAFVADRGNQSVIHVTASAQDHVNAYLEYDRIVGDADGGKLFSPEEYEEFKANMIAHRANRIYVAWRNMKTGMDCRQIGPSSPCFCGHRFKQHATDNHNKDIFCKQGCPCKLFSYIPIRGTQDVKCTCKHSYDAHGVTGKRRCKQSGCSCAGFHSGLSCSCRDQYCDHQTVFETKEERIAAGRPVDNLAGGGAGYEALGGLTSFSSLVDGIDRMAIGASGQPELVGAPPPPQQKKKLTQEDEFALYDAKYKKGGSSYSSVSRPSRTSAASSSSSSVADSHQAAPAAAGTRTGAGGGGLAHQLFHTPHSLAGSSSAAGSSSSATAPPRRTLGR